MATTEQQQMTTLRANRQQAVRRPGEAPDSPAMAASVEWEAECAARFVAAVEGFRLAHAALV
jgi:hypothetical protein